MRVDTLHTYICQLDSMLASMQHPLNLVGRTRREREAYELLTATRDKLVEEVEARETAQNGRPS